MYKPIDTRKMATGWILCRNSVVNPVLRGFESIFTRIFSPFLPIFYLYFTWKTYRYLYFYMYKPIFTYIFATGWILRRNSVVNPVLRGFESIFTRIFPVPPGIYLCFTWKTKIYLYFTTKYLYLRIEWLLGRLRHPFPLRNHYQSTTKGPTHE